MRSIAPAGRQSLVTLFIVLSAAPLVAVESPTPIPPALRDWTPWVVAQQPEVVCPLVAGARVCSWPGRLELGLGASGGRFSLEVWMDREGDVALPGDAERWPREVTSGGRPVLARRVDELPVVWLPAGRHRLEGRFSWARLPETLPVPAAIGLVELSLDGRSVRLPRREANGLLWLASSAEVASETDTVDLEVTRRFDDGVPVRATTRLLLRASGRPREVELGAPLPPGFTAVSLTSPLPARLAGDGAGGTLIVQARPGEWEILVEGRSETAVAEIPCREQPAPWPALEHWSFAAAPAVRTVRVEGAPAVDPQRTPVPEAWRSLPVFQLSPGGSLRFVELSRGIAAPSPDEIRVERQLWLRFDGEAFTFKDSLQGSLRQGGRLEALAPATLGRVSLEGSEMPHSTYELVTLGPESGLPGVEVRGAALTLSALGELPRGGSLPAVGWNRDAQTLYARLNLPYGWSLLHASGVDRAAGSWIDRWTLLDLFILLLLSLGTGKLAGWRWGALTFAVLGLAWFEPHGRWLSVAWLVLLPLEALARYFAGRGGHRFLTLLRWAGRAALAAGIVAFSFQQWRVGLFPQLEAPDYGAPGRGIAGVSAVPPPYQNLPAPGAPQQVQEPVAEAEQGVEESYQGKIPAPSSSDLNYNEPLRSGGGYSSDRPEKRRAKQIDAAAVVQTGPADPAWTERVYALTWSGPVSRSHAMRLWLVSPGWGRLFALLRIAGLLGLASVLARQLRERPGSAPVSPPADALAAAASLWLVLAGAAGSAYAAEIPPKELLDELALRLARAPACDPDCVEVPRLEVRAAGEGLSLYAEVHAAAVAAWPLPGPASVFAPTRVTVDGQSSAALRLREDGFLLLRLEPGVHRVELAGPLPDSATVQFPLVPRVLTAEARGWKVSGLESGGAPGSVHLERELADGEEAAAPAPAVAPWVELERELDLGLPWMVHSRLRREGGVDGPLTIEVPLLEGESVTTAGLEAVAGRLTVTLAQGETERAWSSRLTEAPSLTLTAPNRRGWTERWVLTCSPVWSCTPRAGLAPTVHIADGAARPVWQPWPGESLTLDLVRPAAAPGAELTLDRVELALSPGRRLREGRLSIGLRASRGSEQVVPLPAGAELVEFTVDGTPQPVSSTGGQVRFSVEPGFHTVQMSWREDHELGLVERAPSMRLSSTAFNVEQTLQVPDNRWVLWLGGGGRGSVVTLWLYLPLLAVFAWVLARHSGTPLTLPDWLLLGTGLTQVPLAAAAVVVGWLLLLALRRRRPAKRWWSHDVQQLAFAFLSVVALVVLYVAVYRGLLGRPEMQVEGSGENGQLLHGYSDRVDGELPRPWVLWLPLWCFRVAMLGWALWLASRIVRWLPWVWQSLAGERLWWWPDWVKRSKPAP